MAGRFMKVIGTALVAATGFLMVGCDNVPKKDYDLAVRESTELRERVTALEEENRNKDTMLADKDRQIATLQQAQPAPAPLSGGGGGGSARNEVITIAGDVAFASGSDALKPEAQRELRTIAARIKRDHPGATIRVEGHTDSTPIRKSKWGSNQALSEARAQSVRRYLVSQGISGSSIEAVGMGSSKPKSTAAASRRVEIVVIGG